MYQVSSCSASCCVHCPALDKCMWRRVHLPSFLTTPDSRLSLSPCPFHLECIFSLANATVVLWAVNKSPPSDKQPIPSAPTAPSLLETQTAPPPGAPFCELPLGSSITQFLRQPVGMEENGCLESLSHSLVNHKRFLLCPGPFPLPFLCSSPLKTLQKAHFIPEA